MLHERLIQEIFLILGPQKIIHYEFSFEDKR